MISLFSFAAHHCMNVNAIVLLPSEFLATNTTVLYVCVCVCCTLHPVIIE